MDRKTLPHSMNECVKSIVEFCTNIIDNVNTPREGSNKSESYSLYEIFARSIDKIVCLSLSFSFSSGIIF